MSRKPPQKKAKSSSSPGIERFGVTHMRQKWQGEQERLYSLFMEAPALICIAKGRQGIVEFLNPQFHKLWGYRDVMGKPMREAFHELEGQGWFEFVEHVYDTGESVFGTETPAMFDRDNDGKLEQSYFNFVYQATRGEDKVINGVAIYGVDVTEAVEARKKAESSERQISLVANSIPALMAYIDTEEKYRFANRTFDRWFGDPKKEVLGKPVSQFTSRKKYQLIRPRLRKALSGQRTSYEQPFTTKAGKTITLQMDYLPDKDEDGNVRGIVWLGYDLTTRKQDEEALKASAARQTAFFNAAFNALVITDKAGLVTEFNPAATRILGHTRTQAIGQRVAGAIIPSGYYADRLHGLKRYLTDNRRVSMRKPVEITALKKDGSEFPAEVFIARLETDSPSFMYIIRDISLRKRAEEELRVSEERFRTMAEFIPQKIFTVTPEGDVDYCSPQWEEYSGRLLPELMGVGWQQLIHPDDQTEFKRRWSRSLATGRFFDFELRLLGRGGTYRWNICRAQPVRNEAGAITSWMGSSTDIEESKRTTQRKQELEVITAGLQEQRRQLLELSDAKDEFISLASHQLRTPATGVKQYVGMLLEGFAGELTPTQQAFLEQAYESNERQLTIVDDLLQVAQIDAGKVTLHKEETNVVTLVRGVLHEQDPKFDKRNQAVTFKPSRKDIVAAVDGARLRMVFENLIDNASKYTPEGKAIKVTLTKLSKSIRIAVADQGVGIEPKDVDKVFEKFSRLRNTMSLSSNGSGLGLYWAKRIVDLHGGSITITSKPGEGSVFTILLPL